MENIYLEKDLLKNNLCTIQKLNEIINISENYAIDTVLSGNDITSREEKSDCNIVVKVVFGDVIAQKLSWLNKLYQNELEEIATLVSEKPMSCSKSKKSSININILSGINARYEWHVDTNPVTGLLFVTSHKKGEGGELVFKIKKKTTVIYPKAGMFIAFDARKIPHTVMPLKTDVKRISVPMNFYYKGKKQIRPQSLDNYLAKK